MKLLCEVDKTTGALIGAAPDGMTFVEIPETSESCIIGDEELSDRIWQSHSKGGAVTVTIVDGLVTDADIEVIEPPAPLPTQEEVLAQQLVETQSRLTAQEQQIATLTATLGDFMLGGL